MTSVAPASYSRRSFQANSRSLATSCACRGKDGLAGVYMLCSYPGLVLTLPPPTGREEITRDSGSPSPGKPKNRSTPATKPNHLETPLQSSVPHSTVMTTNRTLSLRRQLKDFTRFVSIIQLANSLNN